MVTLEAWISTVPGMYRPLSTVPFTFTITSPYLAFQYQPGPLDTWPGTDFRVIPLGTPVLVASG